MPVVNMLILAFVAGVTVGGLVMLALVQVALNRVRHKAEDHG